MNTKELDELLDELQAQSEVLESMYEANGGEQTEDTEVEEGVLGTLRDILEQDGIDSLGRWLKAKEDHKAMLKAEKARIDALMKADDNTMDYIKARIRQVMAVLGKDKVKGLCYGFACTTSTTTSVVTERLEDWQKQIEEMVREAGVPDYVTIKVGASVSKCDADAELPNLFSRTSVPSLRFSKPKKAE